MPHGGPDWGTAGPLEAVFTIEDLGELAARLDSISTYDRRGNVILMDDFEDAPMKWKGEGIDGAGNYAYLNHEYVKSGSQAVKFHTKDGDDNERAINKDLMNVRTLRIGFEVSLCNLWSYHYFTLLLYHLDGVKGYRAELRLDPVTGKLYGYVPPGVYEEIGTVASHFRARWGWETMKIVADFKTHKYMRALFNDTEIKIPELLLYEYDAAGQKVRYNVQVWVLNIPGKIFGGDSWIDDAIVTQDEPP